MHEGCYCLGRGPVCVGGNFVHRNMRRQCLWFVVGHSSSINMDFGSLHDSTPPARNLHDEAILHEVYHPWRRAASTPASPIIQNAFVAILQAARVCTSPECATTQPHSCAIHQDERTLLADLLRQQHLGEVINSPAQSDAERGSGFGLEGEELSNVCRCFRRCVNKSCQVRGSGL